MIAYASDVITIKNVSVGHLEGVEPPWCGSVLLPHRDVFGSTRRLQNESSAFDGNHRQEDRACFSTSITRRASPVETAENLRAATNHFTGAAADVTARQRMVSTKAAWRADPDRPRLKDIRPHNTRKVVA